MMKRSEFVHLLRRAAGAGILAAAFAMMLVPTSAKAAVKVNKGCSITYSDRKLTKSFRQDLNGDGKKDTVRVTAKARDDRGITDLTVSVSGEKALDFTGQRELEGTMSVTVETIQMSKKVSYLRVTGHTDNDYILFDRLYSCENLPKLKTRADFVKLFGSYEVDILKGSSSASKLKVKVGMQPAETGFITTNYTFQRTGYALKRTSRYAKVKSALGSFSGTNDGLDKYFKQSKYIAARKLNFMTKVGSKTKAFTAKKGNVLKLEKIWMKNADSVWLRFSNGKKRGWIRVMNSYDDVYEDNSGWFRGVMNRLAG